MVADTVHQLPAIASIDPEQTQLFTGTAQPCEEETGPRRVRDGGGRDDDRHQEPQCIDHQMAFAPFDVFAFVIAALPAQFRGFDALTVDTARRRVLVASRLLAHLGAYGIMETLPVPAVAPLTEIPIYTGPLRIFMGEHAPFDTSVDDIKNGIDHCSHIQRAAAPTWLRGWDHMFDKIPFGISEVCGVWIGVHPQSVLN